ncbi:MAG: carboxypeptidase regulatory-like domain-containing protein, partial [Proteobacteria bacterium]|nr:carboxypeptidase regulatory-like domain-containing protein [Pseudomonadota bacterium]
MKIVHRHLISRLRRFFAGGPIAILAIALLALPVASIAQETTSEVRGNITGPNGEAAVGVSVTITDTRTGRTRHGTTSSSGRVVVGGLAVG